MTENFDDIFANRDAKTTEAPQHSQLSKEEFAAKMKAERESLAELADKTAVKIGGSSVEFKKYLDTLARFERYSTHNTLLVHAQKPEATRLRSYESWAEAKTPVAKGAKSISIYEPGKEYEREDGSTGVSMNIKRVFDISQTSAKPTAEKKQDIRTLLKALVNIAPAPVKLVDPLSDGMGARYDEERNVIEISKGLDGESLFRVMAQEIAYAQLYKNDTQNLSYDDIGFASYAASYAICEKHGIETTRYTFDDSVEYFKDRDGKEIIGELKTIRDTANELATNMARELNPPQRDSKSHDAR